MQVTKKTILPATEREERHRRCNPDIDADVPRLCFISKLTRRRATGCKETGLISILPTVDQFQRVFDGVRMHDAQHRSEHFGASQFAARRDVLDHCRFDEISFFISTDVFGMASRRDLRAVLDAAI